MSFATNASTGARSGRRGPLVGVIVALLFGAVAALSAIGLGSMMRPLFPALSMILGAWLLANGRREDYLALTLWLFLLTPCLRRFVDYHAGWSQVSVLMLAPYATAVLSAGPVLKGLSTRHFAFSGLFAIVFGCVGYGLMLAAIDGRFFAALFDVLRWGVPPCFGLFIALDPERRRSYQNTTSRTLLIALIALSLYGVYQFLHITPWDALWMREAGMDSIGTPEPYLVRVFSTMNSPGSFASYLMAGLLLVAPASASMLRLPAIGLGVIALLLTLVRQSWIGLVIGFGFLLVFGASARARFNILVGLVCLPVVLFGLYQSPRVAHVIDSRLNTLTGVGNDVSFNERSAGYRDFFDHDLPAAPFGSGLGANSFYQSYMDHRSAKYSDGAIIEIGADLGVFAGSAYFLAISIIAAAACLACVQSKEPFLSSCGAVIAAQMIGLLGGPTTVGEIGMLFWIAAGFCLTSRLRVQTAPRQVGLPPGPVPGVREALL